MLSKKKTILLMMIVLMLAGCDGYTAGPAAIDVSSTENVMEAAELKIPDGEYDVPVVLEGGTGKASVESPARVIVKDEKMTALIVWSSDHYDYMVVDKEKYLPLDDNRSVEGHSVFEIPIEAMDDGIDVIGDTTAMSTPHEIEYTLKFDWSVITGTDNMSDKRDIKNDVADDADTGGSTVITLTGIRSVTMDDGTTVPVNIVGPDGRIIEFTDKINREYARMFSIVQSDDGFAFIHIEGSGDFLIAPEGTDTTGIKVSDADFIPVVYTGKYNAAQIGTEPTDAAVLCKPIDDIYLVSSSAMDICASIDEDLKYISFCALDKKDWKVDAAIKAMDDGTLKYAGKYSAPDYELLLAGNCGLAIENTMVYHKPEVIEKLNGLGIPVLVEVSSYEPHPLGRMEWIKLYGVLTGKADEARSVFDDKLKEVKPLLKDDGDNDKSNKKDVKAAFFYITSTGAVNVRKSSDYISRMISLAGGRYIPVTDEEDDDNALSTVNMQMEAFYAEALDADILIYNGTVDGEILSIDDLIKKDKLFADFKAVKTGRVYTTDDNLYQRTMSIPELILDLDMIFNNENVSDKDLIFLKKVM